MTETNKAEYVSFQKQKIVAMRTGLAIFQELKSLAPELLPDKDLAGFHQMKVNIERYLNNAHNDLAAVQGE